MLDLSGIEAAETARELISAVSDVAEALDAIRCELSILNAREEKKSRDE